MKSNTVLISHWKNSYESGFVEEASIREAQNAKSVQRLTDAPPESIQVKAKESPNNLFNQLFPGLLATVKWRQKAVRRNFLNDFFLGFAFIYPIAGLFEILTHRIYWRQISIFALCYSAIFITIGAAYYVIILPFLLTWAIMTLGPLGFILAHIQWILQTNALTALVCRKIVLTHINNQIFDMTLHLHGQTDFLTKAKFITISVDQGSKVHWSMAEFWTAVVPVWALTILRKLLVAATLAGLSVIPLVGPPIVNQLISSRRAFSYMGRYFMLSGMETKDAKNYEYEHLGLFYSFGMAAGMLEFIPIFSIITMTSNTVGAARWSIDIIKKKR